MRNSILAIATVCLRTTVSRSGRDITYVPRPLLMRGLQRPPPKRLQFSIGSSYSAPAATRSSCRPGKYLRSTLAPPASKPCAWLLWGTPLRGTGSSGRVSASKIVTRSKLSDNTRAVIKPPILPPMTMACSPNVPCLFDCWLSGISIVSLNFYSFLVYYCFFRLWQLFSEKLGATLGRW